MTTLAGSPPVTDVQLWQRVCGEYLEMPGLRISVRQGCRLWNADPRSMKEVLEELVGEGFLRRAGEHAEYYVRADSDAVGIGRRIPAE
jgi:hypothetical protein